MRKLDDDSPTEAPVIADPCDIDRVGRLGGPLRDAAVDPGPGDFMAPVNAGQAHAHDPNVYSRGIV